MPTFSEGDNTDGCVFGRADRSEKGIGKSLGQRKSVRGKEYVPVVRFGTPNMCGTVH